MGNIKEFQTIIGYDFADQELLEHALTHSSYANENHKGKTGSNERLEFLGDAVLELVSSEFFYDAFPKHPEGELTKLRAGFVCEQALYTCAERIPLSEYLKLGKGEELSGGRTRPSVISDAFEAVIGAVYIDGGLDAAKKIIHNFVLDNVDSETYFYDSKTVLQEETQKNGNSEPEYVLIAETGPDHLKEFTVAVLVDGNEVGRGMAGSKKHAAQRAAYEALKKMGKV